jgi:hypothetical protein
MEIVHVMGMSCVGKRTLIDLLVDGDPACRAALNVFGTCIPFFPGGADGNRHATGRWKDSLAMQGDADFWLNKWQNHNHDLIGHFLNTRPDITQRGVALWRTLDDNAARLMQSPNHLKEWKGFPAGLSSDIAVIREKVRHAESIGLKIQHFDVSGCIDPDLVLDRPLPGIPDWIESLS